MKLYVKSSDKCHIICHTDALAVHYLICYNVNIKTYIDEQLEKIHNEKIADAQEVMMYLTSVLRGESQSEIVVVEGTGDGYSDARRMMKLPDERERLKAAELIGKRYGMFTDKVNVEGAVPVVIVDDLEDDEDDEFDD